MTTCVFPVVMVGIAEKLKSLNDPPVLTIGYCGEGNAFHTELERSNTNPGTEYP